MTASAHLYLPLQDANGDVYRDVLIELIDPTVGGTLGTTVYTDKGLTEVATMPFPVKTGLVKLWAAAPFDVIVRVAFPGGQYDWYSWFSPSAEETARGEENLLIRNTDSDTGSILTLERDGSGATFLSSSAGRHDHESQGEDGTRMGPLNNNASSRVDYTSVYPRSVSLGEGLGMAGEDGVVLGAGARSPDADADFGEPSQEVLMSDDGSYTPQSVWLGQRSSYAWDEGGRETTILMRNTAAAYFLAPRSTIIGGLSTDTGAYGDDHVWVGPTSPSANGSRDSTVYLGVSTLPANTAGYEGSVNIGTEPEALLWSGRANADPEDAVAIGIDGAVSDHLGNFVDYGVDGYAYDLGDEDPTTPNPVPFHLRNTEIYKPGALDVLGDATIGNSEQATATSDLLGFFGLTYEVVLTDVGDLVELVAHPLNNDDPVAFFSIADTTGITDGVTYYVVNANANDFQVAATIGGGAITFGGSVFAVDLTDAGDLVEFVGHPYADEDPVVFSDIVTTTGVVNGTVYYVVNAGLDDFQVEATIGGGALPLTGDGTADIHLVTDGTAVFYTQADGATRSSIATLPGDPPALLSLVAALTSYGLVISGEAPILADSMNREDGLVGYAQTGQVRESVAVSSNPDWGIDVEIVTSVAKRSADYAASPVYSTYATPVSDVISEATIENWGTAVTDAGLFIRGIYNGADVVPIDGLLAAQDGLYQVEGGASLVLTPLDTWASLPDGVVLRIEADADAIEVFADNVSISTVTNAWCQTGKRHGYVLGAGDASISEFILYAI